MEIYAKTITLLHRFSLFILLFWQRYCNRNQIIGAGTYAMEIRCAGTMTISNTTATGLGHGAILNCRTDFAIADGGGNGDWITQTPVCPDPYPTPIYVSVESSELEQLSAVSTSK
ncbi:hypothetical protein [Nostoc sp. 'Peltigera membranacea cyanobiont' 213]|uniref:hypothetical protein n=1 Tax=Nostoc sp. 'Peltigera membranacea cyanobiont' 213 TaxID=2014530 RepID=UPI00117DCDE9|nr:hypothetical protein [Nostoc sp. 'Peltigera membranacea cyanobiont' 213]